MKFQFGKSMAKMRRNALLMAFLAAPLAMNAQTVTLFGSLSNFDVLNDTGQDAHGFEIELDGITPAQAPYYFSATRYGGPSVNAIPGGVVLRYASPWDAAAQRFSITTIVPAVFQPTFGHSCVLTNIAGCDHYGVVTTAPPTNVVYRWLVEDVNNPGTLVPFNGPNVKIPQPTITVVPPQQIGAAPNVVFQIKSVPPPPPPVPKPVPQFGDAQWVKVYKTELQREVGLDELVDDNPAVPQDPGKLETAWKLLQYNPNSNGKSGILGNSGGVNSGSRSVLRRYEHYKYTGAYSAVDHSAMCGGDGTCSAPLDGELGDFIGAQNAAANIGVPSLTVTRNGNGNVGGSKINCGGACTSTFAMDTVVTLTENPASNAVFTGWADACQGTQPTCTVTINDAVNVTANFATIFTLSVGRGGSGTVTGTPAGAGTTQINCGKDCSAKFVQGTTVTLTATPAPGLQFVNWTGGCSGTAPTCNVVISKDTSVQANFK